MNKSFAIAIALLCYCLVSAQPGPLKVFRYVGKADDLAKTTYKSSSALSKAISLDDVGKTLHTGKLLTRQEKIFSDKYPDLMVKLVDGPPKPGTNLINNPLKVMGRHQITPANTEKLAESLTKEELMFNAIKAKNPKDKRLQNSTLEKNGNIVEINSKGEKKIWANVNENSKDMAAYVNLKKGTSKNPMLETPNLLPNKNYNIEAGNNRFTYATDEKTLVNKVAGELKPPMIASDRARNSQEKAKYFQGGKNTDDAGHLIPKDMGGVREGINIVPMDGNGLNRSAFKKFVENKWKAALERGDNVNFEILITRGKDHRPTEFLYSFRTGNGKQTYIKCFNTPNAGSCKDVTESFASLKQAA